MIDYKYPTIVSGATPTSGTLVAHPMKNYFEKNEEENFESMDSTLLPSGEQISRSRRLKKLKLEEIEVSRSQRLKKLKFEEVKD
jgi:hypothetical protein